MSWESTVTYYQIINKFINKDFAEIKEYQSNGDFLFFLPYFISYVIEM